MGSLVAARGRISRMTRVFGFACMTAMTGLATHTVKISKSTGNVAGHTGMAGLADLVALTCGFLLPWVELEFSEVVICNVFGERMIL